MARQLISSLVSVRCSPPVWSKPLIKVSIWKLRVYRAKYHGIPCFSLVLDVLMDQVLWLDQKQSILERRTRFRVFYLAARPESRSRVVRLVTCSLRQSVHFVSPPLIVEILYHENRFVLRNIFGGLKSFLRTWGNVLGTGKPSFCV